LSKQSFLKTALEGATGLWQKRTRPPDFSDIDHRTLSGRARHGSGAAAIACATGDTEAAVEDFDRAIELLPDFAEALPRAPNASTCWARSRPRSRNTSRHATSGRRNGSACPTDLRLSSARQVTFEVESYELALKRIKTGSFRIRPAAMRCWRAASRRGAALLRPGAQDQGQGPALLALKGEALSMMGRYRQAVELFSASLARSRGAETLSGRADRPCRAGRIDKANADWRRQLELLPESQPAARACVALRLADYAGRAARARAAIAKAPDDPYWRLYRLTALRRLGRPLDAVEPPAAAWPAPLFALLAGTATPRRCSAPRPARPPREALFQIERFRECAEARRRR
jgi:tetratricopeptide (TPR) repeat protein